VGYFALLTPAYIGHLNPVSVLARALMRRRHRVVMIAPLDAEERIRRAGVEFIPIGEVELPLGEWERRTAVQGELTGFAASRYVGKWLGDCARGFVRDLPKIVERERFDGLVMDQICIGAEAVCEVMGLPLAVACSALALNWDPSVPPPNLGWEHGNSFWARVRNTLGYIAFSSTGFPVARGVMGYRRKHRLSQMRLSHINWMRPSLVQVAQQPAFFDFPRKGLPKNFHYTAPWKEPAEAVKGDFPW
jgi:zeaxanthin glucosyltransferase